MKCANLGSRAACVIVAWVMACTAAKAQYGNPWPARPTITNPDPFGRSPPTRVQYPRGDAPRDVSPASTPVTAGPGIVPGGTVVRPPVTGHTVPVPGSSNGVGTAGSDIVDASSQL
jgi:hypothetical protein